MNSNKKNLQIKQQITNDDKLNYISRFICINLNKINLITNSEENYIFNIELIAKKKKIFFYEWHLEKSTTEKCDGCWFTTIVSPPLNIGDAI